MDFPLTANGRGRHCSSALPIGLIHETKHCFLYFQGNFPLLDSFIRISANRTMELMKAFGPENKVLGSGAFFGCRGSAQSLL